MWYNDMTVVQTYATYHSQNAWANISTLGWKKIKTGATDGVNNMFVLLCAARANNRKVNIYMEADDTIGRAYLK